jgi:hypothetical protein
VEQFLHFSNEFGTYKVLGIKVEVMFVLRATTVQFEASRSKRNLTDKRRLFWLQG